MKWRKGLSLKTFPIFIARFIAHIAARKYIAQPCILPTFRPGCSKRYKNRYESRKSFERKAVPSLHMVWQISNSLSTMWRQTDVYKQVPIYFVKTT